MRNYISHTSIQLDIFTTNFEYSGVLNTSGGGDGD